MPVRKPIYTRYYSVEGLTEKLYLEWLRDQINSNSNSSSKLSIICDIRDPLQFVKRRVIPDGEIIFHVCDFEDSNTEAERFHTTIDQLKKAEKYAGRKKHTYSLAYSNITFELWIILHKADCSGCFTYGGQYLSKINDAYGTSFLSLNDYKKEKNFKDHILAKLALEDVVSAITRAEKIESVNKSNYSEKSYRGNTYFSENPSLSIWRPIKDTLEQCGLS